MRFDKWELRSSKDLGLAPFGVFEIPKVSYLPEWLSQHLLKHTEGGWISPDGLYIVSKFGEHEHSALEIVQIIYPKLDMWQGEKAKDLLVLEKGWVFLTRNPMPYMPSWNGYIAVCRKQETVSPLILATIERMNKLMKETYVWGFHEAGTDKLFSD